VSASYFATLSTLAMGTLPEDQIGNASGLYNLFRNIGGSMGISVVNTIVARHSQSHRLELAHNLNGGLLFQRTLSDVHSLVFAARHFRSWPNCEVTP
jgi:hypothetical protein